MERLYKEYDDETLHKVQQLELMILRDSFHVCEKYNLKFFLIGGSALGAIRHKGFIPWDDDIDVSFLRADYDEFVRHMEQEYGDKYVVMNAGKDPNYPLMTTRLMLKETTFKEETFKNIHCFFGIFLDIYVLDNLPDDSKELKKLCRKAFWISKMQIVRSIPFPVLMFHGWKASCVHFCTAIAYGILVLFGVSKKKLYQKAIHIMEPYKNNDHSKQIGFLFDTYPEFEMFERNDIFPLRAVPFEGLQLYLPANIEKSLTIMYGDYMQLPPVEKRKNHYPYELDFGKYKDVPTEEIAAGKYDIKQS